MTKQRGVEGRQGQLLARGWQQVPRAKGQRAGPGELAEGFPLSNLDSDGCGSTIALVAATAPLHDLSDPPYSSFTPWNPACASFSPHGVWALAVPLPATLFSWKSFWFTPSPPWSLCFPPAFSKGPPLISPKCSNLPPTARPPDAPCLLPFLLPCHRPLSTTRGDFRTCYLYWLSSVRPLTGPRCLRGRHCPVPQGVPRAWKDARHP